MDSCNRNYLQRKQEENLKLKQEMKKKKEEITEKEEREVRGEIVRGRNREITKEKKIRERKRTRFSLVMTTNQPPQGSAKVIRG